MMQNFGLEDLSHVQSRRNLLKYLVRVEMASDWFTRICRSILAEEINIQNQDMVCKLGCGLFLSLQLKFDLEVNKKRRDTKLIARRFEDILSSLSSVRKNSVLKFKGANRIYNMLIYMNSFALKATAH